MGGKLITVCGPSFSGKTYLISKLIIDYPDFYIINFEKHFCRKDFSQGYMNFYKDIISQLKNENNVICESVYSHLNHPSIKVNFKNSLNILCRPNYEDHLKRYNNYCCKYGASAGKKRLGSFTIESCRKHYNFNWEYNVIYNGENYNKIKTLVGQYVEN